MDWKLQQTFRSRRAQETGAIPAGRGGNLSICLVYPNSYYVGMSSLGFQTVYRLFNEQPGVVCERAFLPDAKDTIYYEKGNNQLCSIESERPLSEFDVIAFSISFEPDFINLPRILRLAGLPLLASERAGLGLPLVIAGGAAFSLNPEPARPFLDAVVIGEAEAHIVTLVEMLQACIDSQNPTQVLLQYCTISGILELNSVQPAKQPRIAHTEIICDDTEFGHMYLVEVGRGCARGCRFCAAGFAFQPYRQYPVEQLRNEIQNGVQLRKTIGLVGAAVSDHPDIEELCQFIIECGGTPSLSSLRVDRLTPSLLSMLAQAGYKTISIAPEGGSQRMRDLIRKNLTAGQILEAVRRVANAGILNIKMYFIIGLPGESFDDLYEMMELIRDVQATVVEEARRYKRIGEIILSVNPFIPKPFTPLQFAGMEPMSALKEKVAWLERQVRSIANVRIKVEDLSGAYLQGLLSRGGQDLAQLLIKLSEGLSLRKGLKECGIDIEQQVTKQLPVDQQLPWEYAPDKSRVRLVNEYMRAMRVAENVNETV
ncbi:MAG: radical SAM protein [Trichlorobacter sp.]